MKIDIEACAGEAFDAVAKEFEPTMGKPTARERASVLRPLIKALRDCANNPLVVALPED